MSLREETLMASKTAIIRFSFYIMLLFGLLFLYSCAGVSGREESGGLESDTTLAESGGGDTAVSSEEGSGAEPAPAPPKSDGESKDSAAAESEESEDAADSALKSAESGGEDSAFLLEDSKEESSRSSGLSARGITVPSVSGLKAGFADDNKQFNYFVQFLEKYASVFHYELDIGERIIIRAADSAGKSIPNADVEVRAGGNASGSLLTAGKTYADGSFMFFPSRFSASYQEYTATVRYLQKTETLRIDRAGEREITVNFSSARAVPDRVPLDIVFILDTTGSMGEEIERLKTTIEIIHLNLTNLPADPAVRFGMVLYKDRGDEQYVTEQVALTGDLEQFRAALDSVYADGGGDTPEDLQAALEDAVRKMDWNPGGIRLGFIITDAPPHLDYGQEYTYVDAAVEAAEKGIKLFSVGTGGLPLEGEYILRQISQFTSGKYIFLTYGESGESEGGSPGSVSHHTGANYQTDKLEAIIIRFAKEELSYLTDKPLESGDEYFQAVQIDDEEREQTLQKLFSQAIGQLTDYSTYALESGTAAAVLPIVAKKEPLKLNAEYFTQMLEFSAAASSVLKLVERKDLQKILDEIELQLSGISDPEKAAQIGEILGAQVLFAGDLYERADEYELFLKLLRVETGEVLSLTKARISRNLGL